MGIGLCAYSKPVLGARWHIAIVVGHLANTVYTLPVIRCFELNIRRGTLESWTGKATQVHGSCNPHQIEYIGLTATSSASGDSFWCHTPFCTCYTLFHLIIP